MDLIGTSFLAAGGSNPGVTDDGVDWLCRTRLMDLDEPAIRLRVRSLTQLKASPRDRALAVYAFVKRLPFSKGLKGELRSALKVLRAGTGDACDKATLLVAMLRAADIPARMRFILLRSEILRGVAPPSATAIRPVVEAWLCDSWIGTDTYALDAAYVAAARQKLRGTDAIYGYAISANGATLWNGSESAFLNGAAPEVDPMVKQISAPYHDPADMLLSHAFMSPQEWRGQQMRWNLASLTVQRSIRRIRDGSG